MHTLGNETRCVYALASHVTPFPNLSGTISNHARQWTHRSAPLIHSYTVFIRFIFSIYVHITKPVFFSLWGCHGLKYGSFVETAQCYSFRSQISGTISCYHFRCRKRGLPWIRLHYACVYLCLVTYSYCSAQIYRRWLLAFPLWYISGTTFFVLVDLSGGVVSFRLSPHYVIPRMYIYFVINTRAASMETFLSTLPVVPVVGKRL